MNSKLLTDLFARSPKEEDVARTRQCAENIMGHLNRLIENEGKVKYANNRAVLNRLISVA